MGRQKPEMKRLHRRKAKLRKLKRRMQKKAEAKGS